MDVPTSEECAEICAELNAQDASQCKAFFVNFGNCITIQDFNKDYTHADPASTVYVNKKWISTCLPGSTGAPGNCEICSPGFYASGTEAECQPCPENTYSVHEGRSECQPCPEGFDTVGDTAARLCWPVGPHPASGTGSLLDECRIACEENTCEDNASDFFSGNQQMGCSNACYMRDSGVSKSECKSHCDRHKGSGCSLTVEGVDFNLCYPYFVRGDSCGS